MSRRRFAGSESGTLLRAPNLPEFLPIRKTGWQIQFSQNTPATAATDADQLVIIYEFGDADFAVAILTIDPERLMPTETTNFKFVHSCAHT